MEIINAILFGLYSIVATASILSVLFLLFEMKERNRVLTIISLAAGTVISVLTGVFAFLGERSPVDPEDITMFLPAIIVFIIIKARKNILKILGVIVLLICTAEGLMGLMGFVINIDVDSFRWMIADNLSGVIGYTLILSILLIARKQNALSLVRNVYGVMPKWLIPVWGILNLTVYFVNFSSNDPGHDNTLARNVLFSVSALCVFVCIIYFCWKLFSMSFQQSQILRQLDEQHENYERMLSSDQQLRHFRHDYKNHMLVVTALLNAGKTEEASEYLETIKIESGVQARQISTGNFVADAILNNKNSLAKELDINMSFSGTIPERGIASSDLCTILGNLIDNAIEGNKRFIGDKYINIETASRDPFFVLTVENPVSERVVIKNNKIKTTKSDSKNHGIGLKNVGKIAEKYNGKFRLDCDDEKFTADISLNIKSEQK